ncbi:MAG TPA: hypothetical protein PLX89_07320, partial [Verrucomicrobiota bacterium]|nr:hypothetical protein [Verrucomicrobiota bacterium]
MSKSVRSSRVVPPLLVGEAALWRAAGARWRQLFGDFYRLGVSFEWHDIPATTEVDWAPSFHPNSVELCLNLTGEGEVTGLGQCIRFQPWTAGFYRQGRTPLQARRLPGTDHQFITVELAPEFLARHLHDASADLHPLIRPAAAGHEADSEVAPPEPMNSRQRELV